MAILEREFVWCGSLFTYSLWTAAIVLTLAWFIKRQRKVWLIEKIPGPPSLPILGNALDVNVEPCEVFQSIVGLCYMCGRGPIRVWLGPRPVVLLTHCQDAEVLLSSPKHLEKSSDYAFLHPWLGTGLLTATGRKWQCRRKLLTPAFHFKILEDFVEIFNSQSKTMLGKLGEKADGRPFDIFPIVTLCALDIICETSMGININTQEDSDSEYGKAVHRMQALVQYRQMRPWIHPDILFKLFGYAKQQEECLKVLHDFANRAIENRRKMFQASKLKAKEDFEDDVIGKKRRLVFLDLLLSYSETQTTLTKEDIREEVDTFMFAGHDTTATAVNWSLYLLGCHPEIQAKLHEELDSLFGASDRPVTMADLREMKYTENCIKETLRLFPSVPFLARELKEEAVINNYRIPPGTTVMVITYRLHRDPEQFPDPERFDPDRFLPENVARRHPYSYVPFSAGPRNCLGQKYAMMEGKIMLSHIMRRFKVESTTRRENLRILGEMILRPENGNTVKLTPRTAKV